MRKTNNSLKEFLNKEIEKNKENWRFTSGSNYGINFQKMVGDYYEVKKSELDIEKVKVNLNPNSSEPDIVLSNKDNTLSNIEVKSCKNKALSGVTICNSPELLTDTPCILINYNVNDDSYVEVEEVIETQLHKLVTINSKGKYKGCLSSTRDTGKKLKGRNYTDFLASNDGDDYSLEELTDPELKRKTVLMYSASKLIDAEYDFSKEEIFQALDHLKKCEK
ncbi:MAG: hypothetical protein ACRDAG_06730 [Cetobacterium somerae]|uniref:hypothetical protein n=1 Tax=Cetobacterium somerae TaxID=188913 RepID=UPI003F3DE2EF